VFFFVRSNFVFCFFWGSFVLEYGEAEGFAFIALHAALFSHTYANSNPAFPPLLLAYSYFYSYSYFYFAPASLSPLPSLLPPIFVCSLSPPAPSFVHSFIPPPSLIVTCLTKPSFAFSLSGIRYPLPTFLSLLSPPYFFISLFLLLSTPKICFEVMLT
jgi:hypothetical protein